MSTVFNIVEISFKLVSLPGGLSTLAIIHREPVINHEEHSVFGIMEFNYFNFATHSV